MSLFWLDRKIIKNLSAGTIGQKFYSMNTLQRLYLQMTFATLRLKPIKL
jgi:hypothetical protein